jgi:hypothetical protein
MSSYPTDPIADWIDLRFFCTATYGADFFGIYLKTLNEYTVQQVNM